LRQRARIGGTLMAVMIGAPPDDGMLRVDIAH
jgi:hypothetical protein